MVSLHFWQERPGANNQWIHALDIPLANIQWLSLRPLKWLRFAAFAVLGSTGDLYNEPGPNRTIVNYDIVLLNDDANYYFVPDGPYSLIDYKALNERLTSSDPSSRRANFRNNVAERDGHQCVITPNPAHHCDAAHIISHSKGNKYIEFVIAQRRGLYESWDPTSVVDIDMTENGMFVTKDIHSRFSFGESGFLKTPNFALNPDDIPRVEDGEMPALRTTLQHFILPPGITDPTSLFVIPQMDVRAAWFGQEDAPPRLFLDFMYGVALVKHWHVLGIRDELSSRHKDFASLTPKPRLSTYESDDDDGNNGTPDGDDKNDLDYVKPKKPARRQGRRGGCRGIRHKSKDSELSQAMDLTLELSMIVRGCPPGMTVAMILQQREEEAKVRSHQIAREKVEGWLGRSSDVSA